MIKISTYRIMHESEFRKFEKLHKIFKEWTEAQLDEIITGTIHLHRNPKKKTPSRNS